MSIAHTNQTCLKRQNNGRERKVERQSERERESKGNCENEKGERKELNSWKQIQTAIKIVMTCSGLLSLLALITITNKENSIGNTVSRGIYKICKCWTRIDKYKWLNRAA